MTEIITLESLYDGHPQSQLNQKHFAPRGFCVQIFEGNEKDAISEYTDEDYSDYDYVAFFVFGPYTPKKKFQFVEARKILSEPDSEGKQIVYIDRCHFYHHANLGCLLTNYVEGHAKMLINDMYESFLKREPIGNWTSMALHENVVRYVDHFSYENGKINGYMERHGKDIRKCKMNGNHSLGSEDLHSFKDMLSTVLPSDDALDLVISYTLEDGEAEVKCITHVGHHIKGCYIQKYHGLMYMEQTLILASQLPLELCKLMISYMEESGDWYSVPLLTNIAYRD